MSGNELKSVIGGSSISGTLISSIAKVLTVFLDMGRSVGSAINYAINKRSC